MSNKYKSFYMNDLSDIINKSAIAIMKQPQKLFLEDQVQRVENLQQLNDRIAHFNDGVRSLAIYLICALEKEGEEDDDD